MSNPHYPDAGVNSISGQSQVDDAPPHGIIISDAVVAARSVDEGSALERLLRQLDRGLITMREFQWCLDRENIDQQHPCIEEGCDALVPFDDEPRCFTHSPDEGSSVRGYSFLVNQYREQS